MSNRICSVALCCISFALFFVASAAVVAQEFSAEIVQTGKDEADRRPTKVFISKDKMRFENEGSSEHAGAVILDYAKQTTYILMPAQKMYMEATPGQMGMQKLGNWMRPIDPNNACPTFEAMDAEKHVVSCRKVGTDTVNGRPAIKYEGITKEDGTGYAWIDPKLRFFLKWQGKDDSGELRNIQEGPQPASLFEIPAGYQKFDINAMRNQRQKH